MSRIFQYTAVVCLSAAIASAEAGNARVEMKNAKGESLGTVTLSETRAGVKISGKLTNLPAGKHGVHIHQVGKCEAPDFKSAGDHFNPTAKQHGAHNPQGSHVGDLGNVNVGGHGNVTLNAVAKQATLSDGPNSLMGANGTSIVIHANEDDLKTDPSGNAGDRIACGVIAR